MNKTPNSSESPKTIFPVSEKSYSKQPVGLGSLLSHRQNSQTGGSGRAERGARATEPIHIPSVTPGSDPNGSPGRPARRQIVFVIFVRLAITRR